MWKITKFPHGDHIYTFKSISARVIDNIKSWEDAKFNENMNLTSNLSHKISIETLVLALYQKVTQLAINENQYASTKLSIEILYNKFDIRIIFFIKFYIFPCIQTLYNPLRRWDSNFLWYCVIVWKTHSPSMGTIYMLLNPFLLGLYKI